MGKMEKERRTKSVYLANVEGNMGDVDHREDGERVPDRVKGRNCYYQETEGCGERGLCMLG